MCLLLHPREKGDKLLLIKMLFKISYECFWFVQTTLFNAALLNILGDNEPNISFVMYTYADIEAAVYFI